MATNWLTQIHFCATPSSPMATDNLITLQPMNVNISTGCITNFQSVQVPFHPRRVNERQRTHFSINFECMTWLVPLICPVDPWICAVFNYPLCSHVVWVTSSHPAHHSHTHTPSPQKQYYPLRASYVGDWMNFDTRATNGKRPAYTRPTNPILPCSPKLVTIFSSEHRKPKKKKKRKIIFNFQSPNTLEHYYWIYQSGSEW